MRVHDEIVTELDDLEREGLRLLDSGYSIRQAADRTGLGEPHLQALLAKRQPCKRTDCGVVHGPGRPRRGWVNLRRNGVSLWFCSLRCVAHFAASGRAAA